MKTKQDLSPARQQVLQWLQVINFGHLRQLQLYQGEPVLQPPPVLIKDWKLDGDNAPRIEQTLENFTLKSQHLQLFEIFDVVGDGVIDEIHCRYGLPCKVVTTQPAQSSLVPWENK